MSDLIFFTEVACDEGSRLHDERDRCRSLWPTSSDRNVVSKRGKKLTDGAHGEERAGETNKGSVDSLEWATIKRRLCTLL